MNSVSLADPMLQVRGLQKTYAAPALDDFNFELNAGEVHALVGSNGAGKSTFARILAGLTSSDSGEILFEGRKYCPRSKREAEHAGIVMVLQELNLIGTLSIAENLFLNRLPRRLGFVLFNQLRRMAIQALARVGLNTLDPSIPASELGIAQQQLVEIAGALAQRCRILILDEPTAALTGPEIDRLFENIRELQSTGVGIIYITHRLEEIGRIAQRITVLRDGRRVAMFEAGKATPADMVREMVGHKLTPRKSSAARPAGPAALSVRHLHAGERVRDVSFAVRRGEILGLAGLVGAGRTETLRAIFGADSLDDGEIVLGDNSCRVAIRHPKDAVRLGIGMVPEDRKQHALLLPQPIRVNTTIATLALHARHGGWLDIKSETRKTELLCSRLKVSCQSTEQRVAELSGGNQQKIVVARWLARACPILLFDEPTRGIDAAAKEMIWQLLNDLAANGTAIVIASSELTELMAVCDRIVVMTDGRTTTEFFPEQWSEEEITRRSFGVEAKPVSPKR